MLQSLRIKNLALLDEVALEFDEGFTVVTGETGAGKSVLLGALSLLSGARADKTIIRQGEEACEVEAALFFGEAKRIDAMLKSLDLPVCEEGVLILKRRVARTKAPKVTVNGSLTTLTALQSLGEIWIDFHGPSEPRRLLKGACQLDLLDLFGRLDSPVNAYGLAYGKWREAVAALERLQTQAQLPEAQIQFLENQLTKLDALALEPEAIEQLERDFSRHSQAQTLQELTEAISEGLSGDTGVQNRLGDVLRTARQLEQVDDASAELAGRLQAAAIDLADIADEFAGLAGELNFDPEEIADVQARMATWLEVKRRHGGDLDRVVAARESLREQLEAQRDLDGALLRADKAAVKARQAVLEVGQALRAARVTTAAKLAKVATTSIGKLGFKKADFRIELPLLSEPGPQGIHECEFLFSPNVGEAPLPLSKIASSGELARVMLALKTELAELDEVPVLVFDEVDANVGGEIGRVVGEKLAAIAQGHQVFCVTHLPQVAAQGAAHFLVEKDQSGDRAVVRIRSLHDARAERIDELARMLGDRTAASARAHAEELLGES